MNKKCLLSLLTISMVAILATSFAVVGAREYLGRELIGEGVSGPFRVCIYQDTYRVHVSDDYGTPQYEYEYEYDQVDKFRWQSC